MQRTAPAAFTVLKQLAKGSAPGSVHYVCLDWRHMRELLSVGENAYDCLLNLCVWAKDNGGMGSFYRSNITAQGLRRSGVAPFCEDDTAAFSSWWIGEASQPLKQE